MIGIRRRVMRWLAWRGVVNELVAVGWTQTKAEVMVRIGKGLDLDPAVIRWLAASGGYNHWSTWSATRTKLEDLALPDPLEMGRNDLRVRFDETPLILRYDTPTPHEGHTGTPDTSTPFLGDPGTSDDATP